MTESIIQTTWRKNMDLAETFQLFQQVSLGQSYTLNKYMKKNFFNVKWGYKEKKL
jgi:hypothetical protein